jgi:hypothetical protein
MIIKVETVYKGAQNAYRLSIPMCEREPAIEFVRGDRWGRAQSKDALDLLEHVYGISRKKIKFQHR